jgi:membrane protein implicated in regulation of membrane protease activity
MRTILDRGGDGLHVLWAGCGAIVVGYVFLAALGAFEPSEVIELTIAVVLIAGILLTHEWREQFRDERH